MVVCAAWNGARLYGAGRPPLAREYVRGRAEALLHFGVHTSLYGVHAGVYDHLNTHVYGTVMGRADRSYRDHLLDWLIDSVGELRHDVG
jgi:hypothetical protein